MARNIQFLVNAQKHPPKKEIILSPVKYFASGIHQNYGYERFTQSIKSSLMDVYDRFSSQSFELLVVSRNILYCLNLGKNYLWIKPAPNKKKDDGVY